MRHRLFQTVIVSVASLSVAGVLTAQTGDRLRIPAGLMSAPLMAGITPFPASFHTQMLPTNGTSLHVRVGGKGPAVVLLHGFGDTGDMWAPLAVALARNHTIIVPDLRGMGLSSQSEDGYDKKTQARDIARVLDHFKIEKADLLTHDIG